MYLESKNNSKNKNYEYIFFFKSSLLFSKQARSGNCDAGRTKRVEAVVSPWRRWGGVGGRFARESVTKLLNAISDSICSTLH